MNNELPLFETCKELARYLPIDFTTFHYNKRGKAYGGLHKEPATKLLECNYTPAPLLSELLRVSPIKVEITIGFNHRIYIRVPEHEQIFIEGTDNLTEQVAQIILQYYKQKEQE